MTNWTAEKIKQNPFAACYEFGKSLGLQKVQDDEYIGLFLKGEFPLFDYGTGLLWVSIKVLPALGQVGYHARIYIGNADDGDYGSWVYSRTESHALKLVEDMVEVFNKKFPKVLPSLEVMNEELVKVGVYVIPE